MKTTIVKEKLDSFKKTLANQQKSKSTIKTYARAVSLFIEYIDEIKAKSINDDALLRFKENIINSLASASSNTYIVGLNAFLSYIKYRGIKIKCIKRQSKDYVPHPITQAEYDKLIRVAQGMGGDMCAIFKTLAGTGIRVSELKYITVEAIKAGYTEIKNKGKTRHLDLSDSLCEYLLKYCSENGIEDGIIFTGRDGISPLSTSAIWRKINSLSEKTKVDRKKLFPHNLRHFYATKFMKLVNDINVLKDLLGHSDIKTTAIYLHPDGDYVRKCVNKITV